MAIHHCTAAWKVTKRTHWYLKPFLVENDFFFCSAAAPLFCPLASLTTDDRSVLSKALVLHEVEQWYVRHKYFIILYHRLHVSTYIQVIFRPCFTGKSIKCYTCWDPIMFYGLTCKRRPEDDLYIGRNM